MIANITTCPTKVIAGGRRTISFRKVDAVSKIQLDKNKMAHEEKTEHQDYFDWHQKWAKLRYCIR